MCICFRVHNHDGCTLRSDSNGVPCRPCRAGRDAVQAMPCRPCRAGPAVKAVPCSLCRACRSLRAVPGACQVRARRVVVTVAFAVAGTDAQREPRRSPHDFRNQWPPTDGNTSGEIHSEGVGHAAPHMISEIGGHQHFATHMGNAFRWCWPRRSPQDFRNRWPPTLRNTSLEIHSDGVGHADPHRIPE